MIGTPEYMSPEQSDPTSADIDTRSDIYSLGVLLYELIAGATPFDGKELRSKAYGEIQRILREVDPPRPSDRLSTISTKDREASSRIEKARGVRIRELAKTLRSELEWIPLKAMRKEPRNRYQTALEFSNDIRAYLEGKPLNAGPESTGYRVQKYMRRHKALVTGVGAVALALVAGLSLAAWQWRQAVANAVAAETQREVAEAQRARADERADAALKAESAAIEAQQRESSQREEAEAQREIAEAREREALAAKTRAEDLLTVISIDTALDAARAGDPATARRELAILEEIGRGDRFDADLARAFSDQSIATFREHGQVFDIAFRPDGKVLAIASGGSSALRLWDPATGRPIGEPLEGDEEVVFSVAFSPDGRVLASGGRDKTIRLFDAETGQPLGEPLRGHEYPVSSVAFSPDGRVLASGSNDNTIRLWDAATGRALGKSLRGHEHLVNDVAFSPDGRVLASGSRDKTIRLWDAATGQPLGEPLEGHESFVESVAFSPNGRVLASGSGDKTIRLWDAATGASLAELKGHTWPVASVAFSPDGRILASAGLSAIRLWDAATGQPLGEPLREHKGGVESVAFSPDGRVLASGGLVTIRLWDAATGQPLGEPLGHVRGVGANVAFSPDGRILASGGGDDAIRLWHAVPFRERIGEIRERMSQVDLVRAMLAERIATVGPDISEVSAFAEEVRSDPRFAGELRTAALLVVGEVDLGRQAQRVRARDEEEQRQQELLDRVARESSRRRLATAFLSKDWPRTLSLLSELSIEDLPGAKATFWNSIAWAGLVELPPDSPERDLDRLLAYAERAVELSERRDGAMLDTLARAHWELGDAATAIEVQREAVAAAETALAALDDAAGGEGKLAQATGTTENAAPEADTARRRAAIVDALAELRATLARYEREKAASRDAESPPQEPGGVP